MHFFYLSFFFKFLHDFSILDNKYVNIKLIVNLPVCNLTLFLVINSTVANINEVATGLYEALGKVRYPGVTNIERGDLENTILAQNERNKLLHWLLVESLRAVSSTTEEPGSDDASLVKWYVQLGICDNKAALLGHCSLNDQLDTLIRLTRFIMNVLGVNGEQKVIPDEAENILNKYLNTEVNLIPSTCKLSSKLNYNDAKRYMKKLNESMKEHTSDSNNLFTTVVDNEDNVVDGKKCKFDEDPLQTTVETVEKFVNAFQDIDKWTTVSGKTTNNACIDNYIEDIHRNFLTFKETLQNKNEIATAVIPTGREIGEYPLDRVFQDTVISLEELRKIADKNAHK